ncbi:MAG: hypothetical protein ACSHXL_04525, partial [Bacteroidota bacterium]
MRIASFVFLFVIGITSCKSDSSKNELVEYFYPLKGDAQVYLYRDINNGISERFHRIYRVKDQKGEHIVVEIYSDDARIIEAYNYNVDSLNLADHMIVDRDGKKRQAELFKNTLFPMNMKDETYFASRFPGVRDSTLILQEVQRKVNSVKPKEDIMVMGKKKHALVIEDNYRTTIFNPITREESELNGRNYSYFVKGIGLVRWHDNKNKSDFRLQR